MQLIIMAGNAILFNLAVIAQSQCLYLENEIRKKNIDIVALQLKYNGKNELAYSFPAKISMKTTNRTNTKAENSGYLGHFEQTDWTTVYDGNITYRRCWRQ